MAILAQNKGGDYEPAPSGSHIARCVSMVHIGTEDEIIIGKPQKRNKIRLSWELPNEKKVFKEELGEQPFVVSREFTLSMNPKAHLRKFLENWRGKTFTEEEADGFDVTKLLGKLCMISIIHKETKKGNIFVEPASASVLPKGTNPSKQINESFEFNFENIKDTWGKLSDWLKGRISETPEFKASGFVAPSEGEGSTDQKAVEEVAAIGEADTDDLPF